MWACPIPRMGEIVPRPDTHGGVTTMIPTKNNGYK